MLFAVISSRLSRYKFVIEHLTMKPRLICHSTLKTNPKRKRNLFAMQETKQIEIIIHAGKRYVHKKNSIDPIDFLCCHVKYVVL